MSKVRRWRGWVSCIPTAIVEYSDTFTLYLAVKVREAVERFDWSHWTQKKSGESGILDSW